jgi:hypothetical protein
MKPSANQRSAGKAGIASRLTIEHHWPGPPEPGRQAANYAYARVWSNGLDLVDARWHSSRALRSHRVFQPPSSSLAVLGVGRVRSSFLDLVGADVLRAIHRTQEPLEFSRAFLSERDSPARSSCSRLIGSRARERVAAGGVLVALCVLAAGVFFVVPSLPE